MFITFEGIDGSGKTTQSRLLGRSLAREGISVVAVREPGSTQIGEKIRDILLSPASNEMAMPVEILLYAAARAQLVHEVIKPALNKSCWVICDRYIHSSLAYQGYGAGYDLNMIRLVNENATGGLWPSITFVMDITVGESRARLENKPGTAGGGDRIERRSRKYYQRVREGFLKLASQDSNHFVVVPSHLPIGDAHQMIWGIIQDKCRKKST